MGPREVEDMSLEIPSKKSAAALTMETEAGGWAGCSSSELESWMGMESTLSEVWPGPGSWARVCRIVMMESRSCSSDRSTRICVSMSATLLAVCCSSADCRSLSERASAIFFSDSALDFSSTVTLEAASRATCLRAASSM